MRNLTVLRIAVHAVVHIAIVSDICSPGFHQIRNEGDDAIHRLRNSRRRIRKLCIQLLSQILICLDIAIRDHRFADIFLNCLIDDLVIHIRKVRDILHRISLCLKQTLQHIKDDHRPGIADMRIVVDSRSAYIHIHMSLMNRLEFLYLKILRVIKSDHCLLPKRSAHKRRFCFSTFTAAAP